MKQFLFLFFFAACSMPLRAQNQFTVSGTVTGFERERLPVKGVLVLLLRNSDTIAAAFTDKEGKYALGRFETHFRETYTLFFVGACACEFPGTTEQVVLPLSFYDQEYVIDRAVLRSADCQKPDNAVYFLPGDHKTILNFEARRLRQLLDDFPDLQVEFSVLQLPGESARLAKKRLRTFRRLLEDERIPFSRVTLCPEVYYYSDSVNHAPMIGGRIVLCLY